MTRENQSRVNRLNEVCNNILLHTPDEKEYSEKLIGWVINYG